MLFNSFVFLGVFLPITYVVFWLLRTAQARYVWLTVTGYVFYSYWDPRFCLLMAFSTLVSYSAGLGFLRWTDPGKRRLCLVIPIAVDLGLLGFFKYANFVAESFADLFNALGAGVQPPHWNIILPIGISFYTFHTITYIVDSYRGVIRPTRNLFEFSAYVSLFSQLVAGPIVRFRQIEEDLERLGQADRKRWLGIGISFFIIGLVEKVVVADSLASFVDPALARHETLSTAGAWLAMLGYTFQLYFDFAGYSDMAIGLGYMFGLRIPINFNSPYKALDPSDFWRRWHISLSSCLRDYVYIPLGGNRGGNWHDLPQPDAHDADRRAVARRELDLRRVGRVPRTAALGIPPLGCRVGPPAGRGAAARHVPRRCRRLGILPLDGLRHGLDTARNDVRTRERSAGGEHARMTLLLLAAAWWGMVGPNAIDLHRDWTPRPRRAVALAAALGACLTLMLGSGSSPFLYFQF